MGALHVVVRAVARPEKVDELRALLAGLVEPTRREAGCLRYVLLQDLEDPAVFFFSEEWESHAALDAHLASAHVAAALERIPDLLAEPADIRRCRLVR